MIALGLFISCAAGIALALNLTRRLALIELLGLAFPLGIGAQTFLMVCMDWAGVPLSARSVIIATLALTAGLGALLLMRRRETAEGCVKISLPCTKLGVAAVHSGYCGGRGDKHYQNNVLPHLRHRQHTQF